MKLKFQITHANGDVTFCKIDATARIAIGARMLRDCYPDATVEFIGIERS